MHIINTIKKSKLQIRIIILIFGFWILNFLTGCIYKNDLNLAQDYVIKSQSYYQKAKEKYKNLIAKGHNLNRLHFELGRLYYSYREFEKAIEELKKTNYIQAKKLLAISYYRLGNFTDALEIFNKNKIFDDEYLYYYGLTCEKLNLFDKALDIYKKIKSKRFVLLSLSRTNIVEKQVSAIHIKDVSPNVYKIIQTAPTQEAYPQAGALILFCDERIEITAGNNQVSYLHYIIKILNERGKVDFSEAHIDYDSTYEKVELEYARTIKTDGTVVDVGSRHIRDVSKYLNFPLYSNVRVFIISFPEITEGACIEYKLKIYRNQLINKKDFIISYPVQSSEPIISAKFIINLAKDRALHIKTLNEKYNDFGANLKPEIKQENSRLIYLWQFRDIPQIIPESQMSPSVEINPTLLISTFNSWQEIYQWWWSLAKDKIKADQAIKDKVKELVDKKDSPQSKSMAIYNFCAKEIRYVAVEYGQAGYEPHSASDIFKNKYGDCKDQAILLITMLKETGLIAFPALIPTKEHYNLNTDFPSVFFNHCIAAVLLNDKFVFLDPTCQTCSFDDLPADDQDRRILIFREDKYEIQNTPLYPAAHSQLKQNLNIKINKDETITVKKDIFTHGIYDQAQRYWLLYTPPQLIEEAIKEKIQEVSIGAKLNRYNIKNLDNLNEPIILSYDFWGPEYLAVAGNLRIMPQLASFDTAIVARDKRKYPIDFGILDDKEIIFEIEIPEDFNIKYIPDTVSQESPWFKILVEYSCLDNKLLFKQKVALKKKIVEEENYSDFKVFVENLAKRIKQRVVLEKIK